jgi:hypothetical protein
MCKVQWSNHAEDEATWEREDELKAEFPDLFPIYPNLEDEILLKGGRICNTLILLKKLALLKLLETFNCLRNIRWLYFSFRHLKLF